MNYRTLQAIFFFFLPFIVLGIMWFAQEYAASLDGSQRQFAVVLPFLVWFAITVALVLFFRRAEKRWGTPEFAEVDVKGAGSSMRSLAGLGLVYMGFFLLLVASPLASIVKAQSLEALGDFVFTLFQSTFVLIALGITLLVVDAAVRVFHDHRSGGTPPPSA